MAKGYEMSFEDQLIEDMRAHGGEVTQGPLEGHPLMIVSSLGARTGQARRAILTWSRDGDDYIVAGTAGGSSVTPGWVANFRRQPEIEVELRNVVYRAHAIVVDAGPERDRLWDEHVRSLPWFADYPGQAGRVIPMARIRLVAEVRPGEIDERVEGAA
jgi:deazaflavin-dependent oxidoreductase (nitroreductase family)